MEVELLTKEDLQQFRIQLLRDLKSIIGQPQAAQQTWLRSVEVRKLLKISPNTLQSLRVKGSLHPSKIGGILYYRMDEINILLNQGAGS